LRAGGVRAALPLLLLVVVLGVFGIVTPFVARAFEAATTIVRIAVAVGLLLPIGFLMGMAFPLGMRAAAGRAATLTPWLWGINGATSVCASVIAIVIALQWGIAAAFWTGVACYVAAAVGLAEFARRERAA
jgi:hypothetical protein